ncbi:hypothetical protein ABIC08_000714 [Bradyrhizobium sp. RT9b]|uniref:hypothetical protein n=1 Tax=unclassified Bradyrhizobium TaxID=2631580 RepID=UPI003390DA68
MIRLLFAALIVSVMTAPASAAETYVCVGEQSTGCKLTGSTWERAGFLANEKFVISQGETQNDYIVKQTGSEKIVHYCQRKALALPGGTLADPEMICGGLVYNFTFNFDTLRFQQFHGIGYTRGDFPGNTPYIMIGKCTKL